MDHDAIVRLAIFGVGLVLFLLAVLVICRGYVEASRREAGNDEG
jgi:hypothetical protein